LLQETEIFFSTTLLGSQDSLDPLSLVTVKEETNDEDNNPEKPNANPPTAVPVVVLEKLKGIDALAQNLPNVKPPKSGVIKIGKRLFRCGKCKTVFESYKIAKLHYLTEHKKCHVCSVCLMVLKDTENLHSHLLAHAGLMKCKLCNKDFESMEGLKLHFKKHFNSFECKSCSSSFSSRKKLKKHRLTVHMSATFSSVLKT
jgi:hypothetical protein